MAFASGTLLFLAQAVLWPSAESWVRPQANDTIDIRLHVEPGRVLVEMHLPPVPVPIPGFALWPWGGADLARDLSELQAFNEAGEAVLVRETAPGEWEVPLGGGRLSLEYRVNAWKESFTGERRSDVYRPTLTKDLAVVGGRSWFLQPLEGRLALSPVRVAVTGPYREPELLGSRDGVFEDTRMVGYLRIKKLLVLPVIAFCWSHKVGDWKHDCVLPIKIKTHQRPAQSIFRYGLDCLRSAIGNRLSASKKLMKQLIALLCPVPPGSIFSGGSGIN